MERNLLQLACCCSFSLLKEGKAWREARVHLRCLALSISAQCSMCFLLHQQAHSQKSDARKSFSNPPPPRIASHHISMETIWCGLMGRLSCNSPRQKVDSTFLRTSEIAIFSPHCLSSKVWLLSLFLLHTHIVDSPEPKSCCYI